jgi:predicted dienelactone hydrolase
MRLLEISISVLLGVYLIWPHSRPIYVRLAPAGALLVTLIHFGVEGYRWQMIPLYVLTALLGLSALMMIRSAQDWKPLASHLTIILLVASTTLPILLPIPKIPAPNGAYQIGTTSLTLTDESRKELYSGRDESRRFQIQIWYPAMVEADDKPAPWMANSEIFAPTLSTYLDLPSFFLDHLTLVKTPAYLDARIANSDKPFPIILFSHGWNGFNAQNTAQMLELASHGYVVVAVQHTYGAITTVFEDGTVGPNNPSALPEGLPKDEYEIAARKLVDQWAGDLGYTLDFLGILASDIRGSYYSKLDLKRVGVFGHSTGGGAAIEFCGRDPRCKSVLGLDPFMRPVSIEVLENGVPQPAFFMFSQVWVDDRDSRNNELFHPFYANSKQAVGVVSIAGSRHYDFSDLPMLSPIAPQLGLKGLINGKQMVEIMNTYLPAFFDATLSNTPTTLFSGPSPDFPEVRFVR